MLKELQSPPWLVTGQGSCEREPAQPCCKVYYFVALCYFNLGNLMLCWQHAF